MTEDEQINNDIKIFQEEKFRIELNRGMKGQYGWSVRVNCKTSDEALLEISKLDKKLREMYGI